MIVLGLDTTGPHCSAALVTPAGLLSRSCVKIGRGHAEYIGPQVQSLFKKAGQAPSELSRIAVCTGPGSFTGLRVGIALAKGLSLPRDTTMIGISALEVWAKSVDPESRHRVLSAADIRRDQVMWQVFDHGIAVTDPISASTDEARKHLSADMMVTGSARALLEIGEASYPHSLIDPAILAWLALEKDPGLNPAAPLYSRPPDAKLPGGITPP